MSKINLLEPEVFNLISAGEVVERPASALKELVENSIDAGASTISIKIEDGGTKCIEVTDDGCGIEPEDLKKAFLPHATSKIKDADDLASIGTLGFRGEALASIAAVAKVKLSSRTKNSDFGSSISVEGGKFGETGVEQSAVGTKVTVRDLFFCVPARLKFLKKSKTEEQEISNIVAREILAHPEIRFEYIANGKKIYSSFGGKAQDAIFAVYGKEAVKETLPVSASRGDISVCGFVGKPTFSKSNRTYQSLIINGRYVVNLTVQSAVTNAFGDFLMKRQYPFFVLYISMPTDSIDVNVHPNKLDVKFADSGLIYSLVFEAVSRALHSMDYVKDIEEEGAPQSPVGSVFNPTKRSEKIDRAGVNIDRSALETEQPAVNKNPFSSNYENASQSDIDTVIDSMLDVNGSSDTVRDNFGLGSRLLERIAAKMRSGNYDDPFEDPTYINSAKQNKRESENLNEAEPEPVSFSANEPEPVSFLANEAEHSGSGGEFEADRHSKVGEGAQAKRARAVQGDFAQDELKIVGKVFNTYLIVEWRDDIYFFDQHAVHERLRYDKLRQQYQSGEIAVQPLLVPYVLSLNAEDDQIIRANLSAISSLGFEIEEFGDMTYKVSAVPAVVSDLDFNKFFSMFIAEKLGKNKLSEAELLKDKLMQMACKSAVKGGDDLSAFEINSLLKNMGNEKIILFCPHGRPVVVKISKAEIEKWFKRIV